MLSRLLREFLLNVVHLVIYVLVAVENVYRRFWTEKSHFWKDEVTKSDIQLIVENTRGSGKKLRHLVMLADTEHHSLHDLARVVIWSLVAGVPYVSFYDITGKLEMLEEKLFLEIERNKKGVPGCIKWWKKPDLNGYTNGTQAHTIKVNIFSHKDGRPKIADCIRRIAVNEISWELSSVEMTAQELDSSLSLVYSSIPEPDLVVYTGPYCSTNGLLPWQIRLTEFVQLSLDHSLQVHNFVGALNKYSKCDQRFGK